MAVEERKSRKKRRKKEHEGEGEGTRCQSLSGSVRLLLRRRSGYSRRTSTHPLDHHSNSGGCGALLLRFSSCEPSANGDSGLNSTADCCSPSTDIEGGFYSRPRVTDVARDGVKSWGLVVSSREATDVSGCFSILLALSN